MLLVYDTDFRDNTIRPIYVITYNFMSAGNRLNVRNCVFESNIVKGLDVNATGGAIEVTIVNFYAYDCEFIGNYASIGG